AGLPQVRPPPDFFPSGRAGPYRRPCQAPRLPLAAPGGPAPKSDRGAMIGKIRMGLALAFAAASTLVLALTQAVLLRIGLGNPHVMPRLWHRCVLKALGFRVHAVGALSDRRPLLIAANHVSWTDIGVLGSLANVSFIAKSDMAHWPVMGWLATLQRTVFVERERRHRSGNQVNEIARRLKAGDVMVLFAEGTTGDGN